MRDGGGEKGGGAAPFRRVLRCLPREGRYRYLLEVALAPDPRPVLLVIGKNPSTASASRSDPTLGKVEAWARRGGFGRLALVNLFALRSPCPRDLNAVSYDEAVGRENDAFIRGAARRADCLVAAWGNPNGADEEMYARRISEVMVLLGGQEVHAAGMTKKGYPLHGLGWNEEADSSLRASGPPLRMTAGLSPSPSGRGLG